MREEECAAQDREVKMQMEAIQANMKRLMKVVEESKSTSAIKSEISSVKLVPLSEKDDIEAYLVTFERIMKAYKVEEDRWAHYLTPKLTCREGSAGFHCIAK